LAHDLAHPVRFVPGMAGWERETALQRAEAPRRTSPARAPAARPGVADDAGSIDRSIEPARQARI
jgi:hypothetical protein